MAKRSNFRGTSRKLYNPSEVKYLDADEMRREYTELRKVANRRAQRLRKAGFENTDLANRFFAPQSSLSDDDIKAELLDVSRYLRDERTFVQGMREYDKTMKKSLEKYGDVISKDPKRFGDFMKNARARAGGQLPNSERTRSAYENAVKRGMRPETLEIHFSSYLDDKDKLDKLAETLYELPETGRLTIDKLWQALGDKPTPPRRAKRGRPKDKGKRRR